MNVKHSPVVDANSLFMIFGIKILNLYSAKLKLWSTRNCSETYKQQKWKMKNDNDRVLNDNLLIQLARRNLYDQIQLC